MQQAKQFNELDSSQESQYSLPYHYIPQLEDGHFTQHLYWSWGFRYIGGMKIVLESLEKYPFESLIDIGCGDGRFLKEASRNFTSKKLLGIDYSERAINLAKAMNPELNYQCIDISSHAPINEPVDVITLIEVLEHIPLDKVNTFIRSFSEYLKPGGRLLMTVPHQNKPVQAKHFQHFNGRELTRILTPFFEIEKMLYFDKKSKLFAKTTKHLLRNNFFILNNQFLLNIIYKTYKRFFFHCPESKCGRIFVVARKR